jgi:dihydrodipicolinate synthase/N-acetylneuraminate lyase
MQIDPEVSAALQRGLVIPAHPLALTAARRLDERAQRALTRYYAAAGAGGIAVGVHTTQFAIRAPEHGLLRPVLELASETAAACEARRGRRLVKVAGVCGATRQAVAEAELARELGYDLGLLNIAALRGQSEQACLAHCRAVAEAIPLFGFYLQPAVGGVELSRAFWTELAALDGVFAIKVAPFNRYQTLDVVRGVAASGRAEQIALYTGNDDSIVVDLLSELDVPVDGGSHRLRFAGGLLGHWAVWTRAAVALFEEVQAARRAGAVPAALLRRAHEVTDCNAALFDAAHGFAGCIAGLHQVLHQQGLLRGTWCLDPAETLSPGQREEIQRVHDAYPHLHDDDFVAAHLDEWLA